ncbi:MAG: caspase family protein [Nitrospira sp.]|nr:caspase family protein [Nitrospira sp.]
MTKRAVIVGVNDYSVQRQHENWHSLRFCVSDATSFYYLLQDAFLFDPKDMFYLADATASSSVIRQTLRYVLTVSQPGDVVCFYFSGHGGRTPHPSNPSQMYETIIPYSGQYISDHEIFAAADSLPPSFVNFTIIFDSCHSGGMHDESERARRSRSPIFSPALISQLTQCTTLFPCGICLPPQSRQILANNISRVSARNKGVVIEEDANRRLVKESKSTLIAASTAAETAQEHEAISHGLLTKSFLDLVNASNFQIDHRSLIDELTKRVGALMTKHFPGETQSPQLRGQENRMEESFLQGWRDSR